MTVTPTAGASLPAYRVRAHNAATATANRIHDDDVARTYGFRGGLVPGVTVYAYMTHPVVEAFGPDWLARGTIEARFVRPIYDGDMVTVEATMAAPSSAGEPIIEVRALDGEGVPCGVGSASLPATPRPAPDVGEFPARPLPDPPPPATAAALEAAPLLGAVEEAFRADAEHGYLGQLAPDLPVYAELGVAHPGWLVRAANNVLAANVVLGPWIHTASRTTNLGLVRDGEVVSTRARVAGLRERNGHEIVDLDVVSVVGDRPVLTVRHSAIYRVGPARPGAAEG